MPNPKYLFVHGGWHGPWCWEPVQALLMDAGFESSTVDLPMRSLEGDIYAVRSGIEAENREALVVVGHSYAGMLLSAVGHGVARLAYVAAAVPQDNQSLAEALGAGFGQIPGIHVDESKGQAVLTAECIEDFYSISPELGMSWALPRLRPFGIPCMTERLTVPPAWRSTPSTYVVCSQDQVIPVEYQRARASQMAQHIEISADHSPFASAPDELAAALITVADQSALTEPAS